MHCTTFWIFIKNMSKNSSDAGIFLWMTYQTMQQMGLDAASI